MWRRREELAELNTDVLVLSFEHLERVRWYLAEVDFGWPVLADPERAIYRAYGLGRASALRTWFSPRTVRFYLGALFHGHIPQRPQADTHQLGGDFIVDEAGVIRFAHRSVEPADRPTVDSLIRVLKSL